MERIKGKMERFLESIGSDSYLSSYIGKDIVVANEHGGLSTYPKGFAEGDFLMPTAELQKRLEEFSSKVKKAVNSDESK